MDTVEFQGQTWEVVEYGLDWALRQPTTAFDLTFYHLGKSKTPPEYFI